jgi:hypothetical protein
MTFREQFPANEYPLSDELCAFIDAHPKAREALKFNNTKRFMPIPLIFTSGLPTTHPRHADEIIGIWYIDKNDKLCPRHNKVCRFKQDFIVNIEKGNQDFVVYSAGKQHQKYVRPMKEFFSAYGQNGSYYHDGKQWNHHYATITDLPDEPNLRKLASNLLSDYEQTALDDEIKSLRELNDYAYSLLKDSEKKVDLNSLGVEAYLLGLFLSAIAQVQGLICLAENRQVRVSNTLFRTLYEIWVNVRFAYCHRSHVFIKFMVAASEKERVRRAGILHEDGNMSDEKYAELQLKLGKILKSIARQYPGWLDDIPGAINTHKSTPTTLKALTLKQRCIIFDFYSKKFHRARKKSLTMVQHYDRMYPHMSGGTHADLLELSSVFNESPERVDIDLDGSSDLDGMKRLCGAAFALHYDIIWYFQHHILKKRPVKMASWIDMTARDMGLIK